VGRHGYSPRRVFGGLAHELLVDVFGCAPDGLARIEPARALCDELIRHQGVQVLSAPSWHRFAATDRGPGGVTGIYLLSESHLAVHTWPEHGTLLLSLSCCRPLVDDVLVRHLIARHLESTDLRIQRLTRGAR
jgi:S-adenosylmethionine decarboxylase